MGSRIIPQGTSSSYIQLTNSAIIGGIMAAYTIVSHPVKDFDTWKSLFDQFEPIRKEGGERSAVVLRHADGSNMVTVINT